MVLRNEPVLGQQMNLPFEHVVMDQGCFAGVVIFAVCQTGNGGKGKEGMRGKCGDGEAWERGGRRGKGRERARRCRSGLAIMNGGWRVDGHFVAPSAHSRRH